VLSVGQAATGLCWAVPAAGTTPIAPADARQQGGPRAHGPALTLAEALAIFHARGLDLVIADAEVEGAAADAQSAAAIPNPTLFGGPSYAAFDHSQFETHYGWSVGLSDGNAIEDGLSGKRRLRSSVARATLAAAKLRRADAERTLDLQVKQAYVQVVAAMAAVELAEDSARSSEETLRLNQVRYRSGAISEVDLSKTETAKLEGDQALEAARESLHRAGVLLALWLGSPRDQSPDFAIDPRQSRFYEPPPVTTVALEEDALIDRALAARPDLLGQIDEEQRATAARSLASRLRVPDIGLGLQYQQQGAASSANPISPPTLMLTLSATLPVFYQQQGEIRHAEADLRVQQARKSRLAAQVVADVKAALEGYRSARRLVDRMQGRLLDRALRARDLVKLQYEKGAASLLELLDGQRTYILARTEYIQDLSGYWNAVFQLEAAVASELVK
jgi:cobalt-zinc-cadmium efflux system outer membrane protein